MITCECGKCEYKENIADEDFRWGYKDMFFCPRCGTELLRDGSIIKRSELYAIDDTIKTDIVNALTIKISRICKRCLNEKWIQNIEFVIWRIMQEGCQVLGRYRVTEKDIAGLKKLSDMVGGFVTRDEAFVTMDEWQARYKQHRDELNELNEQAVKFNGNHRS